MNNNLKEELKKQARLELARRDFFEYCKYFCYEFISKFQLSTNTKATKYKNLWYFVAFIKPASLLQSSTSYKFGSAYTIASA